jgi:ABC-2 type transport system permease protein
MSCYSAKPHTSKINKPTFTNTDPKPNCIIIPESQECFNFVPGVMTVILMLVSAMMTPYPLSVKNSAPWKCFHSLKPTTGYSGKVFPIFHQCDSNRRFRSLCFRMPIEGSIFLLALKVFSFIITALSLGILISTF